MRGSAAFRAAVAPGGVLAGPWVRNELWRRARAVPSLDLRFAENKSLVDATTGAQLVTFTRASSGTFVGSNGVLQTAVTNVPRFDHNPTTGESLGLLVEEQRVNLALRSEEFDNASWTKFQATVTANTATAPDGSSNADSLIESAIAGTHVAFQNATTSASAAQTFSVYAKANQRSRFQLFVSDTGANAISGVFNLSTGAVISATNAGTGSGATASAISVGNGWYRCILTGIPASSGATVRVHCYVLDDSNNQSYTGDGTSGLFVWGAQLEAGAFPTSYIPTTTATVTRSADVASISGSNFSAWYRQDEGTVFYDGTVSQGLAGFPWFYNISDGTVNNSIGVYQYTNGIYGGVVTSGTPGTPDPSVLFSPVSGTAARHALAVKASDTRASFNGILSQVQANTIMPVVNQLSIGQRVTGNRMTGTIRRLCFWPRRLGNEVLQAMTQ